MAYEYKLLSPADISLLRELTSVFGDAFEDDAYRKAPPSDAYLQSLLSKRHFMALVATDQGKAVGGIAAYELEKFEQERSEIYIYDLAVSEQHRRKGIATALIRTLTEIAKERGAYVVYVQADKVDLPAIQLYESVGTKEDVYHFDFPVE